MERRVYLDARYAHTSKQEGGHAPQYTLRNGSEERPDLHSQCPVSLLQCPQSQTSCSQAYVQLHTSSCVWLRVVRQLRRPTTAAVMVAT